MTTYTFDTLNAAKKLQDHGFDEIQSSGLVEVIALSTSNLVTKQDLHYELDKRFSEIDKRFSEIDKRFLETDNKILKMTIGLGATNIATMTALAFLIEWMR